MSNILVTGCLNLEKNVWLVVKKFFFSEMRLGSIFPWLWPPALVLLFQFNHANADQGDKYQFGMFENFVVNEKVFSGELGAIETLRRTKVILNTRRNSLESMHFLETHNTTSLSVASTAIESQTSAFPKEESEGDLKGSLTGLVVLAATYDLDIGDLIKGEVVFNGVRDSSSAGLGHEDLLNMALVAYERRYSEI